MSIGPCFAPFLYNSIAVKPAFAELFAPFPPFGFFVCCCLCLNPSAGVLVTLSNSEPR